MNVLELFAGSCTFKSVAQYGNHNAWAVDIMPFRGVDDVCDIRDFYTNRLSVLPMVPDVIWASPPCTSFSIAAISHHWTKGNKPKSDKARESYEIFDVLYKILKTFPNAKWYIENPVGKLRKHPIINKFASLPGFRRVTVTYCQYGDDRRKPTDIWTNDNEWVPRAMCHNGDACHQSAPRSSKTGTQGLKNAFDRAKLPVDLCKEILRIEEKNTR